MKEIRLEIEELEERIAPTIYPLTMGSGNSHSPVTATIDTGKEETETVLFNRGHPDGKVMPISSWHGLQHSI